MLAEMREEKRRLREDVEILKRVTAIFVAAAPSTMEALLGTAAEDSTHVGTFG